MPNFFPFLKILTPHAAPNHPIPRSRHKHGRSQTSNCIPMSPAAHDAVGGRVHKTSTAKWDVTIITTTTACRKPLSVKKCISHSRRIRTSAALSHCSLRKTRAMKRPPPIHEPASEQRYVGTSLSCHVVERCGRLLVSWKYTSSRMCAEVTRKKQGERAEQSFFWLLLDRISTWTLLMTPDS